MAGRRSGDRPLREVTYEISAMKTANYGAHLFSRSIHTYLRGSVKELS